MIPRIPPFATFLAACVFCVMGAAQIPRSVHHRPSASHLRSYPAPSNLKVLSRDLTGRSVNEIMEQWSAELGVRCSACHVRDSEAIGSSAPPGERFADDSKPMKQAARIMYSMTLEINRRFITSDDGVPGPVTCGTCHRGNIRPRPFASPTTVLPPDDEVTSQ